MPNLSLIEIVPVSSPAAPTVLKWSVNSFAIVPAAGQSRRLGTNKLLLPWHGATLIEHVLRQWLASDVGQVVVVVRVDDAQLLSVCRNQPVELAIVREPPPQMKESVIAALHHVHCRFAPSSADVWLLAPADLPDLSPDVINMLLANHVSTSDDILVPASGGRRGHPVLIPWNLAGEVEQLADNEGVNVLLARHCVREIECDRPIALDDIDTLADYERRRHP